MQMAFASCKCIKRVIERGRREAFDLGNSLHCHLWAVASEDLVGDNDFLLASPPVLVAPNVAPVQKVSHGKHRDRESPDKWLSSDYWEECIGGSWCEQSIFKTPELILLNPVIVVPQVHFWGGRNIAIVDEPVDEFAFFSPWWPLFLGTLLVKSGVGFLQHLRARVDLKNALNFLSWVSAWIQITLHLFEIFLN